MILRKLLKEMFILGNENSSYVISYQLKNGHLQGSKTG